MVISEGNIEDSQINMLSPPRSKAEIPAEEQKEQNFASKAKGAIKGLNIRVGRDMEHTPYQLAEAFSPEESSKLDRFIQ